MTDQPAIEKRKPRADAVCNRDRVLEPAKAVFSQGGPEASLEALARHAGVGIGTLYRYFPTREALYEAVYRREVEELVELGKQLEAKRPRSRRCASGCGPASNSWPRKRAGRRRSPWPRTVPRSLWPTRSMG
jgi:AcrR family transcriptional regulator